MNFLYLKQPILSYGFFYIHFFVLVRGVRHHLSSLYLLFLSLGWLRFTRCSRIFFPLTCISTLLATPNFRYFLFNHGLHLFHLFNRLFLDNRFLLDFFLNLKLHLSILIFYILGGYLFHYRQALNITLLLSICLLIRCFSILNILKNWR